MAEYGFLQAVTVETRSTSLATAASISDTELEVDNAGDLDAADGGTISLNGTLLEYTGVEWGIGDEDPDTILLTEALAAAADVGDSVTVVIGDQPAEDWYAVVDLGGGDPAYVPITYTQRSIWAPGVYPSVPVTVSEDLQRIEDAPGRPPAASGNRVSFWNTDVFEVVAPGDATFTLTHTPLPGSLHVRWGPLMVPIDSWLLEGRSLTVYDPDGVMRASDRISTAYAYDGAAAVIENPPIPPNPTPGAAVPFAATGWKYDEIGRTDGTDYSDPLFDDSAWASAPAPFGHDNPYGYIFGLKGTWPQWVTTWNQATRLWARRTFTATAGVDITLRIRLNRFIVVYLNGVEVENAGQATTEEEYVIEGVHVLSSNVIALRVTDDVNTGTNTGCYFDVEISQ